VGAALTIFGLASSLGAIAFAWRQAQLRSTAQRRVAESRAPLAVEAEAPRPLEQRFALRHPKLPWIVAACLAVLIHFAIGLDWLYCVALLSMFGLLGGLVDAMWQGRQESLIEQQLADAIDLLVGSLHAGASVPSALESAVRETQSPLRPQLEEMLGRLRLGDDPKHVFRALTVRVPLDNFRLFAACLAVHYEVGGSLAPTMATVGHTIRDRLEVGRRIQSMTSQSRVSTISILGATYFIALIMWRNDPARMIGFLTSPVGKTLVAGALALQAIGVVWAARLSRVKF